MGTLTETVKAMITYKNEFGKKRYWRSAYHDVDYEVVNRDIANQALEHEPEGYEIAKIRIEREVEWS